MGPTADYRYWTGVATKNGADVHVGLLIHKRSAYLRIALDVVETKAMTMGKVQVDLAAMAQSLDAQGKIALYGIHFDTGKAAVKPESDATLAVIAEFLRSKPQTKMYVIGHTDDTGQYAQNMALSTARAVAVVEALATKHRVEKSRLHAVGVGPVAPVTTNTSDEGRALNRRVELVMRGG
jgi:outer membrane protein OmpA-like peptidoglycan-associated protein